MSAAQIKRALERAEEGSLERAQERRAFNDEQIIRVGKLDEPSVIPCRLVALLELLLQY